MKPHVQHRKYEEQLAALQDELARELAFRKARATDEWPAIELSIQDAISTKTRDLITDSETDLTGFVRLQAEIQTLYWLLGLGTNDSKVTELEEAISHKVKLLDRRVRSGQHLDLTPQQKKAAAEDSP